jgi:CRP-like cAMP-binding protein
MDPSLLQTQNRSSAIRSWEDEGGALAKEAVTVSGISRVVEVRKMSIATNYPQTMAVARAPQRGFGFAYGEMTSGLNGDMRALSQAHLKLRFARNETIFNEGDEAKYAYKLVRGAVRLCKHMADGRRQIVDFLLPGDSFGFLQFGSYSFTAEAIGRVAVICYPAYQIEQVGNSTPDLCRRLLVLLSQRLLGMQDRLVLLGRQTAKERVASFLISLADRPGTEEDSPLELPMSRQDIADYLGLAMETVCRELSDLKRARTIGIPNPHQVVLKDIEILHAIAAGDEDSNPSRGDLKSKETAYESYANPSRARAHARISGRQCEARL